MSKDIFYVNIAMGTVNRISYASSNRAPTAAASATPTSGTAPLSVQLNGSASTDPDGDTLTYSWDTDGNGSFGDATGKTPTVTYANGGTFQARLLVTDPGGLTSTSSAVTITVTSAAGPTNTAPPGDHRDRPGGQHPHVDHRHLDRDRADHLRPAVAALHDRLRDVLQGRGAGRRAARVLAAR